VAGGASAGAATFQAQGRFLYEDKIWNASGYTGTVQNLPIRHADVEVVKIQGQGQVVGTGSTDADGYFQVSVTGLTGNQDLYVRCLSSTDGSSTYHIKVVDTFTRSGGTVNLSGSTVHAITTADTLGFNTNNPVLDMGTWVIADETGSGVAQAFNILDNAVDAFDYLASPSGIGVYPAPSQFVVYGWNGTSGSAGSNYYWQGIYITSTSTDTDGWSDTVILHETGHWASDMFSQDHNPGGTHYIGDNFQDPRLSYGEGYATFFCAEVREFRAPRLNLDGFPVDDHVSIYADLSFPPAGGAPGGLGFSYDFEVGYPGQIGTANETNVTSVMWDLVDGPSTPDESPGVDDEPGDETGVYSWDVLLNYMTTLVAPANWITIEDFYRGWFVRHGAGFLESEVDSSFVGLGKMPFYVDAYEPDDDPAQVGAALLNTYATTGGGVVINEIDLGSEDMIELLNTGASAVDLTGWQLHAYRSGYPDVDYTFPSHVLDPGGVVVVHEYDAPVGDGSVNLWIGGNTNINWANGANGACTLEDDLGAAQDFVRWGGSPTPVPPGTSFTGSLASPGGDLNLARDPSGTDTDTAGDWVALAATVGSPNFPGLEYHTIFPEGDADVYRLDLSGGDLVVLHAFSPHSAGEPLLELLNGEGTVVGSASAFDQIPAQAEMQVLAPVDTTLYARVSHIGPYTETAPLQLLLYLRPEATVLNPPVGLTATGAGLSDVGDEVSLTWLNGGIYDSVYVYRDATPVAFLDGSSSSYVDHADRGLYTWRVLGMRGGELTADSKSLGFAGVVSCWTSLDLEADASAFQLDSPWARTTALAAGGTGSLTDSPSGDYGNNVNVSAAILDPVEILADPVLEFDHICITEATFDFGIVEVSDTYGNSWTEIARYDMDDHPGWEDGVAEAGDWVHESLDLSAYGGKRIRVRFRLESDGYVTEDGWYLDNIQISDGSCAGVVGVEEPAPGVRPLLTLAGPNPARGPVRFLLAAPAGTPARVEVFDLQGRLVRNLLEGPVPAEGASLLWDGRDGAGRSTAAGLYLVRAVVGSRSAVQRVVRLP